MRKYVEILKPFFKNVPQFLDNQAIFELEKQSKGSTIYVSPWSPNIAPPFTCI